MKKSKFIATLTKGAVASTIAGVCLAQSHSEPAQPQLSVDMSAVNASPIQPDTYSTSDESLFISVPDPVREWTQALEKEFRKLALEEVKGSIEREGMHRLEELTRLRNQLQDPLSSEEFLFQLKRDRILEKMADALNEYVKFYEVANQKGRTTFQTH